MRSFINRVYSYSVYLFEGRVATCTERNIEYIKEMSCGAFAVYVAASVVRVAASAVSIATSVVCVAASVVRVAASLVCVAASVDSKSNISITVALCCGSSAADVLSVSRVFRPVTLRIQLVTGTLTEMCCFIINDNIIIKR